jgi:hypothetical protein
LRRFVLVGLDWLPRRLRGLLALLALPAPLALLALLAPRALWVLSALMALRVL